MRNNGFVFGVVTLIKRPKSAIYTSQILSTYINIRLRYNYFRFRKTNVSHIGIPLPYLISTLSPPSAFHDALVYQILCKSYHCQSSYHVISTFMMAAAVAEFYCFVSDWVALLSLERSKAIGKPNFVGITQSTAEI